MTDPQPANPDGERPGDAPCRVLIVEDHPDMAFMLVNLLEAYRFEIRAVHSGELAYPAAQAFLPHVVLLDLRLPVTNGYEVAELIRGDATLAATRLIAVSGFGPEMFPELAERARFDHHLTKPVALARLLPLLHP